MFTVYWEMIFQRIWFRLTKVFWAGCLTLCSVCNFSQCRLQSYPCFYSLALIIGLTRRRRRVRFKEYILVIEQRAPSCVFQTIAHPTSPRLSRHGSLSLLFCGFDSNIGKCIKEWFNFHFKAPDFASPAYQIMFS